MLLAWLVVQVETVETGCITGAEWVMARSIAEERIYNNDDHATVLAMCGLSWHSPAMVSSRGAARTVDE